MTAVNGLSKYKPENHPEKGDSPLLKRPQQNKE